MDTLKHNSEAKHMVWTTQKKGYFQPNMLHFIDNWDIGTF